MADEAKSRPELTTDPLLRNVPVHEGYKVLGGVVLYQKLGRGGMGAVYRGRHLRLDVDVAVKVTAPPAGLTAEHGENFFQRFIREARTAAAVKHSNLIRVYDVNTESGTQFIIMDYVDGESAADRLRRRAASGSSGVARHRGRAAPGPSGEGRLCEEEAIEIALGAAEGLAAAHEQGIVHRDVKPDNILIDRKGHVVVVDLGLAKAYCADESDSSLSMGLSMSQQAMGTPYYMSPEQTRSSKDVGPPADVWSLGVALYRLLAGSLPWSDTDIAELIMKIRKEPALDIRTTCADISDGACAIVEKALKKGPAERYADCGEMASALRAHLDSIRTSERSALPDGAAGSTRLAVVSVTPPPSQTMTLIGASIMSDSSGGERSEREQDAGAARVSGAREEAPSHLRSEAGGRIVSQETRGGGKGLVIAGLLLLLVLAGVIALAVSRDWIRVGRPGPGEVLRQGGAAPPRDGSSAGRDPTAGDARGVSPAPTEAGLARREAEAKVVSILKTARSLREAGLPDKARDEAAEALKIVPDHAEAKRFLADVSAEIASKQTEAERAAEHKEWMDEGLRLRLAGKVRGAATAYERAQASARPGSTEAAAAAAGCLAEHFNAQATDAEAKGDFERAVELYAKAVAKKDDPEARRSLADARENLEAKRAEEARRADAARWTARAEDAERSGDVKVALGYYREAARQGADVSSKLSSLEGDLARREEAERRQAAYDGAVTRARTLARGRQWEEAISACEEALRQKPGDREATELLAEAMKRRGPAKTLALDLGGRVTMELMLIPAGEFTMGSPDSEPERIANEGPLHRVKITRPFYMGKCEVRRDQFTRFVSETRYRTDAEKEGRAYTYSGDKWGHTSGASWQNAGMVPADDHPVTCVSWSDAKAFCEWLGGKADLTSRLPTEAEWEYACRAGTTTPFHFGDSLSPGQANFNGNYPYGGAAKGAYRQKTVPVGSFAANAWGLHDMHGNLWEWCADWYDSGYYGRAPLEYPAGPDRGTSRVLRGGSWNLHGDSCRSAHRGGYPPTYACSLFGFRVVVLPAQGR